jgi:SAM-dependent methyltransferase
VKVQSSYDPGYSYGGEPDEEARRLNKQAASFLEHDSPLLRRFGLSKGMRVLDIGCGSGAVTCEIARIVFPGQVIGIDRDNSLVQQARENVDSNGTNVQFVTDDIVDPNLIIASFDFVYCRFVLWAIPDRELALRNMIRLTRANGVVCAQEPDVNGTIHWPQASAHKRYWDGRIKYHQDRQDGIDPALGRKLPALFRQTNLIDIRFGVSALYKENFEWEVCTKEYVGPGSDAVKAGYIDDQVFKERTEWAQNPLSFMMLPTLIVAGHKP